VVALWTRLWIERRRATPRVAASPEDEPVRRLPEMQVKAWRYAYNDSGDLVGTSDARGCGANYVYDAAGRLLAEDYSPCEAHHENYSAPDLTTGDGVEVLYHYDDYTGTDLPPPQEFPVVTNLYLGRLAWVADRASKTVNRFDVLGRVTGVARQVARPGAPELEPDSHFAAEWYVREVVFDAADRPVRESTGAEVSDLLGMGDTGEQSVIETTYSKRGTIKKVGGSYGELIVSISRDADGLVNEIVYGDAANTTRGFTYDDRRRLRSVQTYRGPPPSWTTPGSSYFPAPDFGGPPSTFQLLLQDLDFTYDIVDNPIEIRDWRIADEWPDGAKPVTRKLQYDDLYRVTRIDYEYPVGADDWTSPFDAENQGDDDPRRAKPSPHIAFQKRALRQSFQYDWLGNTEVTDDDAHGFYDRSLGTIDNDGYRLVGASNLGAGDRDGKLDTAYDAAGNLVGLSVLRNGPCLPAGARCSQRFAYDWDEVGRLVRARRWDVDGDPGSASGSLPTADPAVELEYAYDANDARVRKTAVDPAGPERHTLYIFATLELRRADWDAETEAYTRNELTEVPYLTANGVRLGRVVFEPEDKDVPTLGDGHLHVFLELGDHLGSTNIIVDKATSELVELSTFQAYGSTESDYRPERWKGFREDYRFTGKEEDVEVGLVYFGARYYAPQLGRWISPDPLAVHVPGEADLNLYAYVQGRVLAVVDPVGLDDVPVVHSDNPQACAGAAACVVGPNASGDPARVDSIEDLKDLARRHPGSALIIVDPSRSQEASDAVAKLGDVIGGASSPFSGAAKNVDAESGKKIFGGGETNAGESFSFREIGRIAGEVAIELSFIGDIRTLRDPNASPLDKTLAAASLFPVGGKLAGVGGKLVKAAIKKAAKLDKAPLHHIMTNKNWVSRARGGPWSPRFEEMAREAGMTLDDALNKIRVPGHRGPHSERYHELVYQRLIRATKGKSGDAYREAFRSELEAIGKEIVTPGTPLNQALVGQ